MSEIKLGYRVDKCANVKDEQVNAALSQATNGINEKDPFPYSGAKEICVGSNEKVGEYILMNDGNKGRVVFTSGKFLGKFRDLVKGVNKVLMMSDTNFRNFEPIKRAILGQK